MSQPAGSGAYKTNLERWLEEWGFLAQPFEHCYADSEFEQMQLADPLDLSPEDGDGIPLYFVPTPYYEALLACRPTILYGARGTGKTAHRLLLARHARPGGEHGDHLSVEYTTFDSLLPARPALPIETTLADHLQRIFELVVEALLQGLLEVPDRARAASGEWLARLAAFCEGYQPESATPIRVISRCREAAPEAKLEWGAFQAAVEQRQVAAYLRALHIDDPGCLWLADLLDCPPERRSLPPSPATLKLFAELLAVYGLDCLHVLIDGLEDVGRFRRLPEDLWTFIAPLITNLSLLKMPHVSFVFFLPYDPFYARIEEQDPRLHHELYKLVLRWDDPAQFSEVFERRLSAYTGDRRIWTLPELCDESLMPKIERELFQYSDGSIREALLLCNAMLQFHCQQDTYHAQFNDQTWYQALATRRASQTGRLVPELTRPPLRIDKQRNRVLVGEKDVSAEITDSLYEMLLVFYDNANTPLSWGDFNEVGSFMVNADTYRKNVQRLREIIEPDSGQPVYLVTERGKGYRLVNTLPFTTGE